MKKPYEKFSIRLFLYPLLIYISLLFLPYKINLFLKARRATTATTATTYL